MCLWTPSKMHCGVYNLIEGVAYCPPESWGKDMIEHRTVTFLNIFPALVHHKKDHVTLQGLLSLNPSLF